MKTLKYNLLGLLAILGLAVPVLTSCSDEPDSENFYTFTGEMASDYLKNRPQFSEFNEIVRRAGLHDLLAAYGHYTCFVPTNDAVNAFLKGRGLTSTDQLSDADCDTIARTHIVSNMYTTMEMIASTATYTLPTRNMMGRPINTSTGFDNDSNAVVVIEKIARISFEQKDDSVENGIMQPIDAVVEKSNSTITDVVRDNSKISLYYSALKATGVYEDMLYEQDENWKPEEYPKYYYRSHTWNEVAWVPDTKVKSFTFFVVPDSLLQAKYGINDLQALYNKACELYDPVYPGDVDAPGHSFDNLTSDVNPLRRFMQYHVLNKYVAGASELTPLEVNCGLTVGAFGIDESLINPIDWHPTLLPHTMIKVEQLTVPKYIGQGTARERYINRRYDKDYKIEGQHIDASVDMDNEHDALNGHYFYVDDLVVFSKDVIDVVQNMRIRMDFSTVFPEVISNGLRYEGDFTQDDDPNTPDDAAVPKNGRNYYFPLGYLDGVTFSNCYVVLRRPHSGFWSWQGDEWNLFGDYDFTFRIPPVPYSGDWQLRLGFCAIETRGVMQVYFDGQAQGIPLDMQKYLDSELYIGDRFEFDETAAKYDATPDEDKAAEQKLLKNLGAYRAPRSTFHFPPGTGEKQYFVGNNRTYRRILCQAYIDATKDHYIRFRVASDGKQGNNNEFMLDYFEMVPKSVYGVDGEGDMEDDL